MIARSLRARRVEQPVVGHATERDVVVDAHPARHDRVLRDERDSQRALALVHLGEWLAEDRHRAARGSAKPGDRLDQRGLARRRSVR